MKKLLLAIPLAILATTVQANSNDTAHNAHVSKYSGEEKRAIKSLSSTDIEELLRGGGWGLAKAAELNGVPGPVHLLEMKDDISLSAKQIENVTQAYEKMKEKSRQQGKILVELEYELDVLFRNGTITEDLLREQLLAIGNARTKLRYIHLSTHLKTPELLTEQQITRYNALRGYGEKSPCAQVPEGHDASKWRKHNGCE
jgi:Spy/CpxP family protein refolding chaperone